MSCYTLQHVKTVTALGIIISLLSYLWDNFR